MSDASRSLSLPSRLKVLVVDDSPYMRTLIATVLAGFGVRRIVEAGDGAEALQLVLENPPDIALVDFRMAPLDGIEFTRFVRHIENERRKLPIVLISGHTERQLVELARDVGINEVLTKPLTAQEVHAKVLACLAQPREFIQAKRYRGPDRRRRSVDQSLMGRRESDIVPRTKAMGASAVEDLITQLKARRTPANEASVDRLIETLARRCLTDRVAV